MRVKVRIRIRGRATVRVRVRIARSHMKKRAPATPPWQLVRPLMLPMMARKMSGGMTCGDMGEMWGDMGRYGEM